MNAIAFFDVDETLIKKKSMFSFLRFMFSSQGQAGIDRYDAIWNEIQQRTRQGISRAEINKYYYATLSGLRLDTVQAAGKSWVAQEHAKGDFFNPVTLRTLQNHLKNGCHISLVSGSFAAVLDPIADLCLAGHILCTRPIVHNGVMTGEVEVPMIGPHKAMAAAKLMQKLFVKPENCFAYGDHLSDLDLLELVGTPGIVPLDPALTSIAITKNWRILA